MCIMLIKVSITKMAYGQTYKLEMLAAQCT